MCLLLTRLFAVLLITFVATAATPPVTNAATPSSATPTRTIAPSEAITTARHLTTSPLRPSAPPHPDERDPPGMMKPPRWRLPLDGRTVVLRRFAPPAQPWLPGHRGVDLAARPGQLVRAAGSGTVGYAGPLAGRGVVMILHPDGLRTTYLPIRASVRRGQTVTLGDVIGRVEDNVGHCPVSCLHWGLIDPTRYLDALLLLGLGQVRLHTRWPGSAPCQSGPRLAKTGESDSRQQEPVDNPAPSRRTTRFIHRT